MIGVRLSFVDSTEMKESKRSATTYPHHRVVVAEDLGGEVVRREMTDRVVVGGEHYVGVVTAEPLYIHNPACVRAWRR
jgi:hypothetical protein